jgi:hypothetical protein
MPPTASVDVSVSRTLSLYLVTQEADPQKRIGIELGYWPVLQCMGSTFRDAKNRKNLKMFKTIPRRTPRSRLKSVKLQPARHREACPPKEGGLTHLVVEVPGVRNGSHCGSAALRPDGRPRFQLKVLVKFLVMTPCPENR